MRTAMDKAHRVFVSFLGIATVASAAYFGVNAYSIVSHVYDRPKDGPVQGGRQLNVEPVERSQSPPDGFRTGGKEELSPRRGFNPKTEAKIISLAAQ